MYILQNQKGCFLAKSGEWLDGREPARLFKTPHQDEATNQLFEVNSKDISLRITALSCDTSPKGVPIIPNELLPPPAIVASVAREAEADTRTERIPENESLAF